MEVERLGRNFRRGRGDLPADEKAQNGGENNAQGSPFNRNPARQDCPCQNGDIGSCLDQSGPGQHFAGMEVLRQDRVFDRAEESGVHSHREQRQ